MELVGLLKQMADMDGSDLFLTTGAPPSVKVFGKIAQLNDKIMEKGEVKKIALSIMNEEQRALFEKNPEMNLALGETGVGRFRINIFQQRGEVGIVARTIKTDIPNFRALGLPDILTEVMMNKNGLVLFVGGTGSGKSTSLASLI